MPSICCEAVAAVSRRLMSTEPKRPAASKDESPVERIVCIACSRPEVVSSVEVRSFSDSRVKSCVVSTMRWAMIAAVSSRRRAPSTVNVPIFFVSSTMTVTSLFKPSRW